MKASRYLVWGALQVGCISVQVFCAVKQLGWPWAIGLLVVHFIATVGSELEQKRK